MLADHRVLSVLAHPDDESFLCAGTLARFASEGAAVCVVSATRGEAGEIADGVDATRENLGATREQELREAMRELGVEDVRFLDYRDSGMAGTEDNAHPDALAQASIDEVSARIGGVINEFRPSIVFTFGPEGVYLHPDHMSMHHATMAALARAADDAQVHRPDILMLVAMPREVFLEAFNEPGTMFEGVPMETLQQMGTPRDEITHSVDVSDWLQQKREALAQHRTQFGDEEVYSDLPPDLAEALLRTEHFRQQRLPWDGPTSAPFPLADAQ